MSTSDDLVDGLLAEGVLRTPVIIDAFRAIDRRDFVLEELEVDAYLNIPLSIGEGQTISQPYTVAFMLELLQPQVGDSILDIGFGSGWQTALLAHIVGESGHVTAIEIIPGLCETGKENVGKYTFIEKGTVEMHCISGLKGYTDNAPYDRIIAAADAGVNVPKEWLEQTKVGGRIVVPVGSSLMLLIKKSVDNWEREDYPGFVFVPLVDG